MLNKLFLSSACRYVITMVLALFGVVALTQAQYTEYKWCNPAAFSEPGSTSGRVCYFISASGTCWGYGVSGTSCAGSEQSAITEGDCLATASKIECMEYQRTISNYEFVSVSFNCSRRIVNGQTQPQCVCTATITRTTVNPFTIRDCTSRNFP